MELHSPDKIFAFGASPSMLVKWLTCRHQWWLHYVARKGRDVRESQKDAGSAFHNFLQAHYSPLGGALALDDHNELFQQDFPEEEGDEKREQKHCLAILKAYLEKYPRETEPFEVIDTEQTIQVPVEGCALGLNVKIDTSIERFGGLWVMDHKTSGRLGPTHFDQFRNHWQTYCYIYAVGKHYQRKCEGILYNCIGLKKKIDNDSFLRNDFTKTQPQMDHHMQKWAEHVNEMYEFVGKHWQDGSKFLPSNCPIACRAYNRNCFALDYCEFNMNERLLP